MLITLENSLRLYNMVVSFMLIILARNDYVSIITFMNGLFYIKGDSLVTCIIRHKKDESIEVAFGFERKQ